MADITEVILKGACAGQAIYNVLHFRNNGDLALSTFITALGIGTGGLINTIAAALCNDYTISSILTRANIDTTPGPQLETGLGTTITGGVAETSSHLPTSAVIKWLTDVGGRSGRGRSYFGPLASSRVVDGNLHNDQIAPMQDIIDTILGTFMVTGGDYNGNWEFGVWSRVLSAFNPVTGGVKRTQAKTQRRRQLGVGI